MPISARSALIRGLQGLAVVACVACHGGGHRQDADKGGHSHQPDVCNIELAPTPDHAPVDPCRDGLLVAGPDRVEAIGGSDETSFAFSVGAPSAACVIARSVGAGGEDDDESGKRVSAAWLEIDDELLIGPERFNQHVAVVEEPTTLDAGAHTLSVRVAGPKHAALEVEVKATVDGGRHGLVRSKHLELFNLRAEPIAVSSGHPTVTLSAEGNVIKLGGSVNQRWTIRYAFEIQEIDTCEMLQVLSGEIEIDGPTAFRAEAEWDGTASGLPVPDGRYAFRLRTVLVREGHRDKVIDYLATAYQEVRVDRAGPPHITITAPAPGALVGRIVSIAGTVAGSVQIEHVTVNGLETALDQGAWSVKLSLDDGPRTITAQVIDLFGRSATASVEVVVDRETFRGNLIQELIDERTTVSGSGVIMERVRLRFDPDGRLLYLAGYDLAPGCSPDVGAVELMRCFVGAYENLFEVGGEAPDPASWAFANARSGELEFSSVKVQQVVEDMPVENGDGKLLIHQGRIVRFSGRLFVPSELPLSLAGLETPGPIALAAAEEQTGKNLELDHREFDARGQVVVGVYNVPALVGQVVRLDETHLAVLGVIDLFSELDVQRVTSVGKYDPSAPYELLPSTSQEVFTTIDWTEAFFGTCIGRLRPASASVGQPTVMDDPDDDQQGFPYAEFISCSETLRFMHEDLGSQYGPFVHPGSLMHTYFWMNDVYDFARASPGYSTSWSGTGVKVLVQSPAGGCAPEDGVRTCAAGNTIILVGLDHVRLHALAHEYGHVVANMMGSAKPNVSRHVSALHEGFAEQNVLRYSLHRRDEATSRPHDPVQDFFYFTPEPLSPLPYMHDVRAIDGQIMPVPPEPDAQADDALFYRNLSQSCQSGDPHMCGSIVSMIYWELAFNHCQSAYDRFGGDGRCENFVDARGDILIDSALSADPISLTNAVFGLSMQDFDWPDDDSIGVFFDEVGVFYDTIERAGWISLADYQRFNNALAHHCLGWFHGCDQFRKLPGSRLPVAFTTKLSFEDGYLEDFSMAHSWDAIGTPTLIFAPFPAQNDPPFMRFDSTGDGLTRVVEVPSDIEVHPDFTVWSLRAALRAPTTSCAEPLRVQVDSLEPVAWNTSNWNATAFRWSNAGVRWRLNPGSHSIRVQASCPTIDLDAFVLEPDNCVPNCDGHNCEIEPTCNVQCPCCDALTCADHLCGGPFPDGCGGELGPCAACPAGRDWLDASGDATRAECDVLGGEARIEEGVGDLPGRLMLRLFMGEATDLRGIAARWNFRTRVLQSDGSEITAFLVITAFGSPPGDFFIIVERDDAGIVQSGLLCGDFLDDGYELNAASSSGALELIIDEGLIRPDLELVGEPFDYSVQVLCSAGGDWDFAPENGFVSMNAAPVATLPSLPGGLSLCP